MKIKSLELLGFKSFPDRTILEYKDGITGIVGPNGCGKSNIVDAIRWVMGEMSAKHLRGKLMEDVIFAGSSGRNATNFAEVALTLSLEDGKAPAAYLNFSELTVRRRLHRSGESEYFINQSPCRLKDIYDVFLGSGVGTKAYSIIEQGQIGAIVTSKPEDRRFFIEEAAGISKFKSRKEAAERKIESTKQNLVRLSDILAELKRQINSLDRQAKKAERFRELRGQARELELHLTSLKYLQSIEALKSFEGELAQIKEKETLEASQLDHLETKQQEGRLHSVLRENELMKIQEKVFEKNNAVQLAKASLEYQGREIERLKQSNQTWLGELGQYQEKFLQQKEQSENFSAIIGQIFQEFGLKKDEVDQLENRAKNLEQEEARFAQELDLLQNQILTVLTSLSQQNSKKEALANRAVDLKGRMGRYQAEIDEIDHQVVNLKKKAGDLHSDLSRIKQLKLDLGVQSVDLENTITKLKEELTEKEKELDEERQKVNLKDSRFASLLEMERKFEGFSSGVQAIMAKKGELASHGEIFGTIADIVETEPAYESAVGAVLGERLQCILVQSQTAGVEALQYLKTESQGRSSFIPVMLRNNKQPTAHLVGEGVIGPLKEFVRVKSDYERVGDYLFGDVYLVENLSRALELWNDQKVQSTLVTYEGEVVDPIGMISGGAKTHTNYDIFEKKREIKVLKFEVQALKSQIQVKEEILVKVKARLQSLQQQISATKQESHNEEIRIVHQEKDLIHLEDEIKKLQQRRDNLSLEISAWLMEDEEMRAEAIQIDKNIEQAELDKKQYEGRMLELRQQLEQIKLHLETGRAQLLERKVQLGAIEEKKLHSEKEMERFQTTLQEFSVLIEDRQGSLTKANQEILMFTEATERLRGQLTVDLQALTQLEEESRKLKEVCEKENLQLQAQEVQLKGLRQSVATLREELNGYLMQVTQARNDLQMLKQVIFERYHLDIAEAAPQYQDRPIEVEASQLKLNELKEKLEKMGEVNIGAIEEYEEIQKRHEFLNGQYNDLNQSIESLQQAIHKINRTTRKRFKETFEAVNQKFKELFPQLFKGGQAELRLTNEEDLLTSGVEIVAQPPGKKLQSISLLSGGEKALTAISLVFSIFLIKPSPFCLLDEVDAPLDDANIDRFNEMVKTMATRSQFILITHNKRTMEIADILYGITMEQAGVSKLVSVELN